MHDLHKQLVILSGKGGTGKTSVTAAFAHLATNGKRPIPLILADADVDAANLELVLIPEVENRTDFWGGQIAKINPEICGGCGTCIEVCRFDAIGSADQPEFSRLVPDQLFMHQSFEIPVVDPIACDGCAACVYQCPEGAITMELQLAGAWFRSQSRYGPLFHAALQPAQENSGKLVTVVKQNARLLGMDNEIPLLLVDGPPGIGCPVISAVSGADLALIVAEPTAAGVHDMDRILQTTNHFGVNAMVCINKADIYPAGAAQIEAYCEERDIKIAGKIPFDTTVTEAMVHGQPVTAYQLESAASQALISVWEKIVAEMEIMNE